MGRIFTRLNGIGGFPWGKKKSIRVHYTQASGLPSIYIGCTSIGQNTIPNKSHVRSVEFIGDKVTSIGENAFLGCSSLTSITIPSSVTSIGMYAFSGCINLMSVTIPNSVTSIGYRAFYGCTALPGVTIPSSVTSIGNCAFGNTLRMKQILVDSNNQSYSSQNGMILSKDGATLVACPGGLTSVNIPGSVTSISGYAFAYCSNLIGIYFPGNAPYVDQTAFLGVPSNCCAYVSRQSSGWNTTIPGSWNGINIAYNSYIGLKFQPTGPYKKAGIYSAQRDYTITPVLIDWGDGTIEQVNGDVSQKVHTYASAGRTFEAKIYNVKTFAASTSNHTWYNATSWNAYTLKEVAIGLSVTSIDSYAFYGCRGLTSVTIGNSVTSIGYSAFGDCSGLVSVTIPDSVTNIGSYAFYGCSGLTSVTIGNSVTSIGYEAFSYCRGLTSMTIPDNVTNIGTGAFLTCTQLSSMTFQGKTISQVQSMPNYDFGIGKCYDPQPDTSIPVTVTCSDGSFTIPWTIWASCFLKGTDILLSDGTTKKVEDLTYDDVLKVWDFDEGELGSAKVCWLTRPGLKNDHYYQLTFDDGTVLKTTGVNSNHRIFSVDQSKFTNVCDAKVGDKVYSINGVLTITDVQYIEEECEYWNVITSEKYNCFANGILTSDRYGNIYPISGMKYVKDGRTIRPYSDYEAVGISRYWYDNFRLGEVNETLDKTREYVMKCEAQMLPVGEQ